MEALQNSEASHLEAKRESLGRRPNLPPGVTLEEMQAKLDELYWHHSIDFGHGLISKATAPADFIEATADALYEGLDLTGKTLMDIGAWNGAYSFEAKFRGAERVLATDEIAWVHPVFKGRDGFDLALQLTGLDIDVRELDVPAITSDSVGYFDAVLFAGVFYHLLDPIHLTKRISACAEHLLILETHQDSLDCSCPGMTFYPGDTLNRDATNWWGPNPHCMYELLKEFGFGEIHYRDAPRMPGRIRGIYHAFRSQESMSRFGVDRAPDGWISLSDSAARDELFKPLGA